MKPVRAAIKAALFIMSGVAFLGQFCFAPAICCAANKKAGVRS